MARRKVKYPPEVLEQFIQPEDLAETMKFVALMPKRTSNSGDDHLSHEHSTVYSRPKAASRRKTTVVAPERPAVE
jgi:hypothetical protein